MIPRIFLDTDIVLDLLLERQPHYSSAAAVFAMADRKRIKLYVSALSFANANYILSRKIGVTESRNILRDLKALLAVLPVDEKVVELALNSEFTDFEDAIQHFCASGNNIQLLLTRNVRDYRQSQIRVITAEEFVKMTIIK
jgi:predicted nucleic acid-binding protein